MVELILLLIALGLGTNLITMALAVRKFNLLENLFLLNWKVTTTGLFFIQFGFFTWFFAEIMQLFSRSAYEGLPGDILRVVKFFLLICGQIALAYPLIRKVRKLDS